MRLLLLGLLVLNPPLVQAGNLAVSSQFPGGSAKVLTLDQKERLIRVSPAGDSARGWPAWWYFKLDGLEKGETITLQITGGEKGGWALPDRAVFSLDERTWQQTPPGKREGDTITYRVSVDAPSAWFAWGPPFVLADAEALIRRASQGNRHVQRFELCKSRTGHIVPALKISYPGAAATERLSIWVQARQHAWESGGSWVCRGFVEWILSDDPRAESLRSRADIYVVPIMDVDSVETGNGGKNQKPHDHNRDWSANPVYPEVKAAQEHIRKLNEAGRFDLFVDLHNPAPGDKRPFFFIAPNDLMSPLGRQNQTAFLDGVRAEMTGPLKLGLERISGPEYDRNWEKISKNWVKKNCADWVVALTLETSWNTPDSTTAGYLTVGKQLGLGIERAGREWKRK